MNRPHILLIMSDQFRHDALGCNGNSVCKTANFDRLAASGINFVNSYTPNPVCVPARLSLTTGCYPHKAAAGSKDNNGKVQPGFPTLGEELTRRGYETYAVGKLHYLPYRRPGEARTTLGIRHVELAESGRIINKFNPTGEMRGLEDYHDYLYEVGWGGYTRGHGLGNNDVYPAPSPIPEEHYVDSWVAKRAMAYMERHLEDKPDQPFFMWASFPKPHSAFDPPRPFDTYYDPREMPAPFGDISLIRKRGLDYLYNDHYSYIWDLLSPETMKTIKAYYYGLIALQDKLVGQMLDFLENKGIRENTIVVFLSDHGELLGDFGLFFKRQFYNGSVKVPIMISYPAKIKPGQISDEPVGLQDILPTLCSLIGTPLGREVDGCDLSPVLFENRPVRDFYVSQSYGDPGRQQYMIADKAWKYVYHEYGGVEELYNELEDPAELNNLAESTDPSVQQRKTRMQEALLQWCLDNEDAQMIASGRLSFVEQKEAPDLPHRHYLFGRRFY